jgi:predicted RNase H-like HicB family nuclease
VGGVVNGPTDAMPQDFWQKIGAAASAVVNSLVVVGQMIYEGLVAHGTFLQNLGEAIWEWGPKVLEHMGEAPCIYRATPIVLDVKLKLSATVHREGAWFVSWCPELDVASQGRTVEQAISNLREAVELYLEGQEVELPQEPFLLTTIEVEHSEAARPARP